MKSRLRLTLLWTVAMTWQIASLSAEDPALDALEREFTSKERSHWSFQPIRPVSLPNVRLGTAAYRSICAAQARAGQHASRS